MQSKSWQSAWNAGDQITVGLNLNCWEGAARFLGQSQSKVMQNQSSHGVFSTLGCAILLSLTQVYHVHRKGVESTRLWLISTSNALPLCCNRFEAVGPFCCSLGDIHFPCDLKFEKELFCTVSLQGVRDTWYVNDGLPRLLPLYVMMFCHLYLPCR